MILTQSLASFEAELDTSIWQQTAAVDAFLASRTASAWAVHPRASRVVDSAALPLRDLRRVYMHDMAQPTWHAFADAQASSSHRPPAVAHPEIEELGSSDAAAGAGSDNSMSPHQASNLSIFSLPESPISFHEAIRFDRFLAASPAGTAAAAAAPAAPVTRRPVRCSRANARLQLGLDVDKKARLEQFLEEDVRQFLELRWRSAEEDEQAETAAAAEAAAGAQAAAAEAAYAQTAAPTPASALVAPSVAAAAAVQEKAAELANERLLLQLQPQQPPTEVAQQQQPEDITSPSISVAAACQVAPFAPSPQQQQQHQHQQQQRLDVQEQVGKQQQQQQQQGLTLPVFESDDDIAAQKAAAREAMAAMDAAPDGEAAGASSSLSEAKKADRAPEPDRPSGSRGVGVLGTPVPARPRPFAALYSGGPADGPAAQGAAYSAASAAGVAPVVACGQVAWWLLLGLLACVALQPLMLLQSSWAGSGAAFAPKGRLLLRLLQQYPWAVTALAFALLAALLPNLMRSGALHFADASVEARYSAWLNRRHVRRDLLVHAAWLVAGTGLYVQARSGIDTNQWLWSTAGGGGAGTAPRPALDMGGGDADYLLRHSLSLLTPLALLGPGVLAALAAGLSGRWYASRREEVLVGTRLAQTATTLLLRALAPARLDGAWPLLALAQLSCALLMRVRFSTFMPAQLVHVLVAVCAGGACTTGPGALLHISRLLGFGWCAPALLVFALETYSRRTFTQSGYGRGGRGLHRQRPHPYPAKAKVA